MHKVGICLYMSYDVLVLDGPDQFSSFPQNNEMNSIYYHSVGSVCVRAGQFNYDWHVR